MSKYYPKRQHERGTARVEAGFFKAPDGDQVQFRVRAERVQQSFRLTYDEACDLSDALEAALYEHEQDPLS